MGKKETAVRYDADGARRVMRKRDYLADFGGQFSLGLMANLVGQLTYFYTYKVGLAVGGVGIVMMIAKVLDAFTDVMWEIWLTTRRAAIRSIIPGCCGWQYRQQP